MIALKSQVSLERNTRSPLRSLTRKSGTSPSSPVTRSAGVTTKLPTVALLSTVMLGGCAGKTAEESTPGADSLFREFSACRAEVFQYVAGNERTYEQFGPLRAMRGGGMWFDVGRGGVYRFEKPVKMNGLTVVAAGYAEFKGDGKRYNGGDATYLGFYFSEGPEDVFMALRDKIPAVARMRMIGGIYENMKVLQPDGDKRYDQGSTLEANATQTGAKSYFNCSIQYVIPPRS